MHRQQFFLTKQQKVNSAINSMNLKLIVAQSASGRPKKCESMNSKTEPKPIIRVIKSRKKTSGAQKMYHAQKLNHSLLFHVSMFGP